MKDDIIKNSVHKLEAVTSSASIFSSTSVRPHIEGSTIGTTDRVPNNIVSILGSKLKFMAAIAIILMASGNSSFAESVSVESGKFIQMKGGFGYKIAHCLARIRYHGKFHFYFLTSNKQFAFSLLYDLDR